MNIVRLLGNKRVLSSLFGIALFMLGTQYALTPRQVHVVCDARWAMNYQRALTKKVERLAIRTMGVRTLRETLIEEFPCIKDIICTYASTLKATVTLVGWRPLVVIRSSHLGNNEYVICETGTVLDKQFFTKDALLGVPHLIINDDNFEVTRQQPECIEMALKLSPDIFERYDITWHAKTNITLRDKHKRITITADISSIHDLDRYAYIERIYASEKKYASGMTADIRLKDSLVCAPQKRSNRS